MATEAPTYPFDLFTDEALEAANDHNRALRELGPVVWLEAHDAYVLPRYAEVRAALGNAGTFCSGRGVGLNDQINSRLGGRNLIMTDGDVHKHLRNILARGLTPRALRHLEDDVWRLADDLVARLVERGRFDAVTDLARALPLTVVPDLVGWPEDARSHLLEWAAATFDVLGPMNQRAQAALQPVGAMMQFAAGAAADGNMRDGAVGAGIIDAVRRGEIDLDRAAALMVGYIAPSLDTTISAIGSAVWLFATHPEQWQRVRSDPSLIPNAFNEAVRIESPIRVFSRTTAEATRIGGTELPAGARVVIHFASANRDERQFVAADAFDVTRRNANQHVGFGYGVHGCAGQALARMEGHAVLHALAGRVDSFELTGPPVRSYNNLINAWANLPIRVRSVRTPA